MRRGNARPPADIESALDDLGIEWRASGSDEAAALCPSPDHDDTSPSWSINLGTGLHGCFSCGYAGNWLTLVRTIRGGSLTDAQSWTNKHQSVGTRQRVRGDDSTAIGARRRARKVPKVEEADLWKFTDPPRWARRSRKVTLAACREYGVLWDAERELWILPIRDPDTNALMGWQEKAEDGREFRNVPRGVEKSRTLFGLGNAKAGVTLVLVESPLDAVRLRAAGIHGAVSSFGVRVSDHQLSLLRSRGGHVLLALDNDSDGLDATARLLSRLPRVRVFSYLGFKKSERKDPGDMSDEEVRRGIKESQGPVRFRSARKH